LRGEDQPQKAINHRATSGCMSMGDVRIGQIRQDLAPMLPMLWLDRFCLAEYQCC
jgi:hypothetical protein